MEMARKVHVQEAADFTAVTIAGVNDAAEVEARRQQILVERQRQAHTMDAIDGTLRDLKVDDSEDLSPLRERKLN